MAKKNVQDVLLNVTNKEYIDIKPLGKDYLGQKTFNLTVRFKENNGDISTWPATLHELDIKRLAIKKRFVELGCTKEDMVALNECFSLTYSYGHDAGSDPGD